MENYYGMGPKLRKSRVIISALNQETDLSSSGSSAKAILPLITAVKPKAQSHANIEELWGFARRRSLR
jgi:hypothetical protein